MWHDTRDLDNRDNLAIRNTRVRDHFKWMLKTEQLDKRTLKLLFSREVLIIYAITLRPISYLISGKESKVVFGISSFQSCKMVELQGNSETIWPNSFIRFYNSLMKMQ